MAADRAGDAPDPRDPDPRAVRRAFGRAARSYDQAAALQREVGARLASRLDVVRLAPATIADLGCGTGEALAALAARYPKARLVAVDAARPMLVAARERERARRPRFARWLPRRRAGTSFVCADATALPLAARSVDLLWSNLMLQWVPDVARAFAEFHRVLRVGGLLTFTTFGPDTLKELARAFAGVDAHTHVSRFVDLHDLGDLLVRAGFGDPVMDMETITVTYPSPQALLTELKAIGATNQTRARPRGLTGRARHARVLAALSALARDGRVPASFEVVYGHAWVGEPKRTAEGLPIVRVERRRQDAR
jgi:malonyl-CoA O-methyltransferase